MYDQGIFLRNFHWKCQHKVKSSWYKFHVNINKKCREKNAQ